MQRPIPKSKKSKPSESGKKKTIVAVLVVLLLLSATAAWAMWSREDSQMLKVREMGAQIEDLPREQRREHFEKMREEMDKLTDAQRDQLRSERRQKWEARETKQLKEFFALPPDQQIAALDKRIDEMQKWRKERESRPRNGEGRRGGGPGGGGGGKGGQRTQSFGRDADGGNQSTDRRKDQLDRGTADGRAARSEMRRMMVDRMGQRGIR